MLDPLITVDIEKSDISSNLNASLLLVFGMGMYTVIYFGTMYIYFQKGSSKRYIVPATITMLFLCNVIVTGVQWYGLKWQFVDNGDTRDSVFLAIFDSPAWVFLAFDIPSYIGFVLADGLLIWRCFFVWNSSVRVILAPLLLIITEAALFFVQIIIQAKYGDVVPAALVNRFNDLLSAAYFMPLATSLVTTVLIAYRIYSTSRQEGFSKRRFRPVIDIVVQSGVVYSLVLLVAAVAGVLPGADRVWNTWSVALNNYSTFLANIIAGISTTILVARVSMLATKTTFPSASIHLSGLQFHARSTHLTAPPEDVENTHSIIADRNEVGEEHQVEGKVQ